MRHNKLSGFGLVFAVLFSADILAFEIGEVIEGRVIRVADGDTVTVLRQSKVDVRVRLAEIDAPESGQAFGRVSRDAVARMCLRKDARVVVQGADRYGRVIGRVYCDGVDVAPALVSQGLAWVYDSYVTDHSLYRLQGQAKSSGLGLWSERRPVEPWVWRRGESQRKASGTDADGSRVKGNRVSRVYHVPGCPSYGSMSPNNAVYFSDEADAAAAGFRKAANCPG